MLACIDSHDARPDAPLSVAWHAWVQHTNPGSGTRCDACAPFNAPARWGRSIVVIFPHYYRCFEIVASTRRSARRRHPVACAAFRQASYLLTATARPLANVDKRATQVGMPPALQHTARLHVVWLRECKVQGAHPSSSRCSSDILSGLSSRSPALRPPSTLHVCPVLLDRSVAPLLGPDAFVPV